MAITKLPSGWLADLQPGGRGAKRYRKILPTKAEALQYEAWLKTKVVQQPEWAPARRDARRLDDLLELWHQLHGVQLRSGDGTKSKLLHISKAIGNPLASSLTADQFAEYRARRLKAERSTDGKRRIEGGISASNLNRELSYLRAMFNELRRVGAWKGENPLARVRQFKVPDKELSFLTLEQMDILLEALEAAETPDALLIAKICLATGARWSEGETLKTSQIRNGQLHFAETKSGKNRSVPVSDDLIVEIEAHHEARWGKDRHAVPRLFQSAYDGFRKAIERSGLKLPKGQLTHVLRHYPESKNIPRRIFRRLASRASWLSLLGIVSSPATPCGATGDDHGSEIQEPVPTGAEGFVFGVRSGFC